MVQPPYLQPGDTIALVCPAGYMPAEKTQSCIQVLTDWGYRVLVGATVGGNSATCFSGTDAERLTDLQRMLDDRSVRAILCARGGYGTGRLIERLDFSVFVDQPKWIIGFSDITILHAHIFRHYGICTLHAPMAAAFNEGKWQLEFVQSLRESLQGFSSACSGPEHPFNRLGVAKGTLVGGNLALMAHLIGTSSELDTTGKILFIEDVGEQLYNIDRMMCQLYRSGKLARLAAMVVGGFSDCKDSDRPFGKTAYEIIHAWVSEYTYPVCFDFPVSHTDRNMTLKHGASYELKIDSTGSLLAEW